LDQTTDLNLVLQVQKGYKPAFDLLVVRYQFKVLKLVSRYVKDNSDANDIAQESFIKAYRGLHNFRGDSAFYTWLYRIAINTAKNHAINQNRRSCETDLSLLEFEYNINQYNFRDLGAPEKNILKDEIQYAVYDVIRQLPKELKTAITLREMEGLSYEEIAGIMFCPVGTVRSRIFRAREYIEKRLRPYVD
jgi:RNA polymerase sigma-70 factor (ECF subfamily)